ncbi:hypothetical protein BV20DRAFT_962886 [Pilatotrama ljubarskyi]|nr:hypothetical protein BV20DRAFT_962886 [Pilatotrama ljubarskyi]
MGKKHKSFVESKDVAVELAKSVADVEEQKAKRKVELHHNKVSALKTRPQEKGGTSSKARLERAKAAVAAKAARAKKEKAKLRKKGRSSVGDGDTSESQSKPQESPQKSGGEAKKKRVTFG